MKKLNNKGFSLVELIIVIAIMAILVGVMAPSLMRYIEKSRYSSDVQVIDSAFSALKYAVADETAYGELTALAGQTGLDFDDILAGTHGAKLGTETSATFGASVPAFKSKAFSGQSITVDVDSSGEFTVNCASNLPDYDSVALSSH